MTDVDHKHRHGDEIGQRGAGLGQRFLDVAEGLAALCVEIAGEVAAIVGGLAGVAVVSASVPSCRRPRRSRR